MKIVGVDIGGTKCAVVLSKVNNGIKIIDKIFFATETDKGYNHAKDRIFQSITEIIERNGLTPLDIGAVGVSCGGPLDPSSGVILCPPNLPGWVNIPFVQMINDEYGIPAYLQNDANACALVEWKLGAGKGFDNIIFLTMGTGMGAGIISHGVLVEGTNGMGGEVGHIRLDQVGPWGFGKNGSFEGYCSGGGIARHAVQMTENWIGRGDTPAWINDGYALQDITAKLIAEYASKGDPKAIQIYRETGEKLGEALSILIDALNPDRIIIGSIFERSGHLLRESMEEAMLRESIPHSLSAVKVVPAQTGDKIGDYASVMAACHAIGLNATPFEPEEDADVLRAYEELFLRYPDLSGIRTELMDVYLILKDVYQRGCKLLLCGNGGSAADCGHITGELMKGFNKKRPLPDKLKNSISRQLRQHTGDTCSANSMECLLQDTLTAVDLTQNQALATAFSNDVSPALIFAQQVKGYGVKGDALLAISTSGNSENCRYAALTAKALGITVISLTGPLGGKLSEIADCAIKAPGKTTPMIQEYHLPIYHTLCAMLEEYFF